MARFSPEIARILHDVAQVLGSTGPIDALRPWSDRPKLLAAAWEALRDNAETVLFESAASHLRESALAHAARIGHIGTAGELELGRSQMWRLRAMVEMHVELTPKLLLLASAAAQALAGNVVGQGASAGVAEKSARGLATHRIAPEIALDKPLDAERRLLLDRIDRPDKTPYRVLALWPDYLEAAWSELDRLEDTRPWGEMLDELTGLARELAQSLPYSVALSMRSLEDADHQLAIDSERGLTRALATYASVLVDITGIALAPSHLHPRLELR